MRATQGTHGHVYPAVYCALCLSIIVMTLIARTDANSELPHVGAMLLVALSAPLGIFVLVFYSVVLSGFLIGAQGSEIADLVALGCIFGAGFVQWFVLVPRLLLFVRSYRSMRKSESRQT